MKHESTIINQHHINRLDFSCGNFRFLGYRLAMQYLTSHAVSFEGPGLVLLLVSTLGQDSGQGSALRARHGGTQR